MQSLSPPPTYFSPLIPKEYSALNKERFACRGGEGLLTNMANTCPGFSETGSLSNIRFPLSHEHSWNYQALGTDALDCMKGQSVRRGHCSVRNPFSNPAGRT